MAESSTRVLIVDDDPTMRQQVRAPLEHERDVVAAADGLDGIRAFHRTRTDIVVLDAAMPRIDGFELLHRIRELGDAPVIMLADEGGSEYVNELGYVKSYVRLVRRKIEENPQVPRYLISRRGLGYTLVRQPSAES